MKNLLYNLYIRYKIGENGCSTSNSGRSFSISDSEWHHIAYVRESYVDEAEREWRVRVIYIDGETRTEVADGLGRVEDKVIASVLKEKLSSRSSRFLFPRIF